MTSTKADLKDTKDFLLSLSKIKLPEESEIYLVTADVSSLYTIIQHDDALLGLNWAFSQREDIPYIQKKVFEDGVRILFVTQLFLVRWPFLHLEEGGCYGLKICTQLS